MREIAHNRPTTIHHSNHVVANCRGKTWQNYIHQLTCLTVKKWWGNALTLNSASFTNKSLLQGNFWIDNQSNVTHVQVQIHSFVHRNQICVEKQHKGWLAKRGESCRVHGEHCLRCPLDADYAEDAQLLRVETANKKKACKLFYWV